VALRDLYIEAAVKLHRLEALKGERSHATLEETAYRLL